MGKAFKTKSVDVLRNTFSGIINKNVLYRLFAYNLLG